MIRCSHHPVRPDTNRLTLEGVEHFDPSPYSDQPGSPDEHQRPTLIRSGFKGVHLRPVGISVDFCIQKPPSSRQHQPRAGDEGRLDEKRFTNGREEACIFEQLHLRSALSSRENQTLDSREIFDAAHLDRLMTEPGQHRQMRPKASLQRKDADPHHQPRRA